MLDETQLPESEIRKQNLLLAYQNPDYVTLYRYENPKVQYDEAREGVVSKKELIGSWFTSNSDDFRTYIKQRQPGGRVITIRLANNELAKYDASRLESSKDMDIEKDNFIIPESEQVSTRIEIPLAVKSTNPNKFLLADWQRINEFFDQTLASDKLIEYIKNQK